MLVVLLALPSLLTPPIIFDFPILVELACCSPTELFAMLILCVFVYNIQPFNFWP